jgi:hypothetical protein
MMLVKLLQDVPSGPSHSTPVGIIKKTRLGLYSFFVHVIVEFENGWEHFMRLSLNFCEFIKYIDRQI